MPAGQIAPVAHVEPDLPQPIRLQVARSAPIGGPVSRRREFAGLVRELRVTGARGVALVVLIQPSTRDLTEHVRPNRRDFASYAGYSPDNLSAAVTGICARQVLTCLDLTPVFRDFGADALSFRDDDHWNDTAQALAARELAVMISERSPRPQSGP